MLSDAEFHDACRRELHWLYADYGFAGVRTPPGGFILSKGVWRICFALEREGTLGMDLSDMSNSYGMALLLEVEPGAVRFEEPQVVTLADLEEALRYYTRVLRASCDRLLRGDRVAVQQLRATHDREVLRFVKRSAEMSKAHAAMAARDYRKCSAILEALAPLDRFEERLLRKVRRILELQ